MKREDLRKKSSTELKEDVKRLRKEIMDARFDHATGKLLNTASLQTKKRELARTLTFLNNN